MDMKKFVTLAFAAALLGVIPAYAQTNTVEETWDSLTTAATSETDVEKQIQLLVAALGLAQTPEEKFQTNLNISYARYHQGIYGEAVYYADEALKIADTDIPNDARMRSKAVVQKSEALRKVGRVSEANDLINDSVNRKSQKGDHIWRDINNGIRHRFTAMICPDFAGQLLWQEFHNFSQAGTDVGCTYELISEHMNAVTLYMSRYDEGVSDLNAIKTGGAAFLERLPESKKIAVEQFAKFTSGAGNPVYYTQVTYGSVQDGEKYTGVWTQVIGDWILKTRVTWAAELGVEFGTESSEILFSQNTDNIIANFKSCEALGASKSGKRLTQGAGMMALVLASLTSSLANELEDQDLGADKPKKEDSKGAKLPPITMPSEPTITCFAEKSSGDEIVLGYHPEQLRRYSSYSAVVDQQFYVELEPLSGLLSQSTKPQFLLKSLSDDSISIFQIYDGEPNSELVFEDIIDVLNGELPALGSAKTEDDHNVTVYVNPDTSKEGKNK